jgi:hypothetical protein
MHWHARRASVDSLHESQCVTRGLGFFFQIPLTGILPRPCVLDHQQFSLLITSDLLTIPPPTTFSPFRHDRFDTLLHRRGLPRLSPRADLKGRGECRRAVKDSLSPRRLSDRLGRIEFTCVTDWSFSSGCSQPSLTGTQLPLSDSGR